MHQAEQIPVVQAQQGRGGECCCRPLSPPPAPPCCCAPHLLRPELWPISPRLQRRPALVLKPALKNMCRWPRRGACLCAEVAFASFRQCRSVLVRAEMLYLSHLVMMPATTSLVSLGCHLNNTSQKQLQVVRQCRKLQCNTIDWCELICS